MKKIIFLLLASGITFFSCRQYQAQDVEKSMTVKSWQQKLDSELPMLGHRNWILIVDKAFPALNAPGMEVIYADDNLLNVLKYTLSKIDSSSHVRPIIYVDKEMQFMTPQLENGVNAFRDSLKNIVNNQTLHPELHDSVFTKIQRTSELFKVLVIKTNGNLAYSSVFLQLDCAYWNSEQEGQLRKAMKTAQ
jgi:hypothetical protein